MGTFRVGSGAGEQEMIAELLGQSHAAKRESDRQLENAKVRVEKLIAEEMK